MRRKDRELKEREEIELIIKSSDVCRIAFADSDMPYIVTMNFGYRKGPEPELYFHCATQGRKLDMMRKNNYVCFEMDTDHEIYKGRDACDWGMKYSSVVGYGRLSELEGETERKAALDKIMEHYGGRGKYVYDPGVFRATALLVLKISEMTGKRKV
jgi:nitroimidazol reductase NimA-like FMN-containing flavoprotein (pyridoxamine 5'-phosphate oxidase superfamily)